MFDSQFNSDNWHRDATSIARRNAIRTRRWGMRVTVYQGASAGDYILSYGLASTNLQDNANWLKVADIGETWGGGGGGASNPQNEYFTADGVDTVFTLVETDAVIQYVEVGGQVMQPVIDYAIAANVVTFVTPPGNGTTVGIYYFVDVTITTDFLSQVTVDSTGATITLDMVSLKQRMFVGSASFATPKAIALSDDVNALVWDFQYEITNVAAVLSFDANFLMQSSDLRWNNLTQQFTPTAIGKYEASAVFNGTEWFLKISDPFS